MIFNFILLFYSSETSGEYKKETTAKKRQEMKMMKINQRDLG